MGVTRSFSRREFLRTSGLFGAGLAIGPGVLLAGTSEEASAVTPGTTEWSRKVIDSTMKTYPKASDALGWQYPMGLFLYGTYTCYKRTKNSAYLTYIKTWADTFVDSKGHLSNSFGSLDAIEPANVMVALYNATHDTRYRTAAKQARDRIYTPNPWPTTPDGGYWHADTSSRAEQLWCDGTYMLLPFLARYGKTFNSPSEFDTCAKQLEIYDKHLRASNGLWYHAYDETGKQTWVAPGTHHSQVFWGRAMGWFMMALIEVLENMPSTHSQRATLISIFQFHAAGIKKYQDSKTGRWFQVVDQASNTQNWLETSCSSMFAYALSRGIQRGYITASTFATTAKKAYAGVLQELTIDKSGTTQLANICIGTNVGDLAYYLSRPRATNDFHGLGSFVIMAEQFTSYAL